jgi:hypothetical protein
MLREYGQMATTEPDIDSLDVLSQVPGEAPVVAEAVISEEERAREQYLAHLLDLRQKMNLGGQAAVHAAFSYASLGGLLHEHNLR